MEGSNYILYAGGDALEYWSKPMHKKCSMTSIWGYLFGMCGSYDQFFDSPHIPDCAHMYAFRKPAFYACNLINLIPPLPF